MPHIFRVVYSMAKDTRRRTSFFEAEQTPTGWLIRLPDELANEYIKLEAVSLFDNDLMPKPAKQEVSEASIQRAEQLIREHPEWTTDEHYAPIPDPNVVFLGDGE